MCAHFYDSIISEEKKYLTLWIPRNRHTIAIGIHFSGLFFLSFACFQMKSRVNAISHKHTMKNSFNLLYVSLQKPISLK